MTCYQIKDWNLIFENERSRAVDKCSFVCVPNKQHGMGFSRIVFELDGAAIYGIFHMIAGACSQQRRPRAGWLTDNGQPPANPRPTPGQPVGVPWDATDLSIKFRRPVAEIQRALDVLCSEKVGWMTVHTVEKANETDVSIINHQPTPVLPPTNPRLTPLEEKERMEGKEEKERNGTAAPTVAPELELEASGKFSRAKTMKLAEPILNLLNDLTGRKYQPTADNLKAIACRLEEVALDTAGVENMVKRQVLRWKGNEKMDEFLRVSTLFRKTKFHEYFSARDLPVAPRQLQPRQEGGF